VRRCISGQRREKRGVKATMPHEQDELIGLLARLAGVRYHAAPGEWDRALELLNLALDYQPAVALVLAEGRWRQVANVRAYVATAAVRLALRLGIDPRQGEVLESPVRVADGSGEPASVDSLAHYVDAEGELVDVVETATAGGPAPTPWARPSDDLRPVAGEMIGELPRWLHKKGGGINWRLLADILAPHGFAAAGRGHEEQGGASSGALSGAQKRTRCRRTLAGTSH
jgi:hypothetical protein